MKSMTKQNTMIISPFALKHFKHFAMLGIIINIHSTTLLLFSCSFLYAFPVVISHSLCTACFFLKKINNETLIDSRAVIDLS